MNVLAKRKPERVIPAPASPPIRKEKSVVSKQFAQSVYAFPDHKNCSQKALGNCYGEDGKPNISTLLTMSRRYFAD